MAKLNKNLVLSAAIAIAFGVLSLLVAAGVFPFKTSNDSPLWLIGLIGAMFISSGIMMCLRNYPLALDTLAVLILAAFTTVFGWVTFFAPVEGYSGGIRYLVQGASVLFARSMFGLGTLMCLGGFAYALLRVSRHLTGRMRRDQD